MPCYFTIVYFAENFRAYKLVTNIPPPLGVGGKHYYFHPPNLPLGKNISQTGELLESATQSDSIPQTIYPDHQIELEALANQTPIDIQRMLDNFPEPDVTEQRKRKTITQGLFLHADHNYLSMPSDITKGMTIGPDFILNGSTLYKTYIQKISMTG